MRPIPLLATATSLILVACSAFAADSTTVNWSNTGSTLLLNGSGVALSGGVAATNKDGALVQLGYFSSGTTSSNFLGTWVPLTLTTTVGDSFDNSGLGNGFIGFNTFFSAGSSSVDVYDSGFDSGYYATTSSVVISSLLPAAGQVLAIRFFDTNSGGAGSHYNTVSSDSWLWVSPTTAGETVNLTFTGTMEFQDAANPYKTTLVPEPSSVAMIVSSIACGLFGSRRRRRAR